MDSLRRFAFLLCHDWHLADDLVGVTLGNLYRNWGRARGVVHLDAYVRKIVVRSWLDERRRPWRREFATEELPDQPVRDETDVVDSASALEMLAGLTPRRRAAVILRFYFDLSVAETAEVLGCSTGTVRSLTARGLDTARRRATSGNGETA
jgi:RNA polymerase sigma-70 factor (sigma-E family)